MMTGISKIQMAEQRSENMLNEERTTIDLQLAIKKNSSKFT